MKITIEYTLYPDKDFCLNNPEKFNGKFVDEIDSYVGKVSFDGAEPIIEAKDFLERLLCDGIHVKPSCYYLLQHFCDVIDNLEDFISDRNSFILTEPEIEYSQSIGGNYEGTEFKVTISRDEKTAKKIYSVETELHGYADDTFIGTIGECEDYIRNHKLLESKDIGEVRVALLTVQNDGETHCEELYKCEKAYRVDENQNAVSCIVYRKMIR